MALGLLKNGEVLIQPSPHQTEGPGIVWGFFVPTETESAKPASGHFQTSANATAMSALLPLATTERTSLDVRFVPSPEVGAYIVCVMPWITNNYRIRGSLSRKDAPP